MNTTFADDATAAFDEVPAQGPYTLAMSNSAIFIPLANITANYSTIISQIRALSDLSNASKAMSYLPADYRIDARMVAGYQHQLSIIADLLENTRVPSMETPFSTGTAVPAIMLHPLSRGTIRIDQGDPVTKLPIIDYRTGSNPIDIDLHVAHTKYLRRMIYTQTLQNLGAIETSPGTGVQSDAQLADFVRNSTVGSYMHTCCTAAMLPKERGGVVRTDLKIHGATGLRVVDMSILPMLPSSHLSATAYAVGEKASRQTNHQLATPNMQEANVGYWKLLRLTNRCHIQAADIIIRQWS